MTITVHRTITEYTDLSKSQLFLTLTWIVHDLTLTYDQIGFLRSQELEARRTAWQATLGESVQARDRAASYAASPISAELVQQEARRDRLNAERALVERLIDHAS